MITQPVGNDLPFGYRVFVDDGSGEAQVLVYASTGIDAASGATDAVRRTIRSRKEAGVE